MSSNRKGSDVSIDQTLSVIYDALISIDSPISLSIFLLLTAAVDGDKEALSQLASYSLPVSSYLATDIDRFRLDYQASVICSKLPNIFGLDLKERALESFSNAEYQCAVTNAMFIHDLADRWCYEELGFDFVDIKHILSRILGRAPSLDTICSLGGWGPGASYGLSSRYASPEFKSEYDHTVTYGLLKAITTEGVSLPPWFCGPFQLVPGNLVTTVPKNLKTDRTIAVEPAINSWFQKGIGSSIRYRLRKHGIDLNDQSFNSFAALEALSCDFCTVDLKAASDSISIELVRKILPHDWLRLIELTRSARGSLKGRNSQPGDFFEYQKVSSMGNGFTFELESCVFLSVLLACGVPSKLCYVYGDDLIFPSSFYPRVCACLRRCGFEVNDEKSFSSGLFYESCGVFSFNGVDVTPFKVKEILHGPKDFIVLANKVRLFAHLCSNNSGCDRRFLSTWRLCVSGLPDSLRRRCRGPVGSGLTLFCNIEEVRPAYSQHHAALRAYQLVPRIKKTERTDFISLLQHRLWQLDCIKSQSLYGQESSGSGNVVKQKSTGQFRLARLYVEKWYSFGDWSFLPIDG